MKKVTIEELLKNDENNFRVPLVWTHATLVAEEKETLLVFKDIIVEFSEDALPLDVYLLGGSRKKLSLYPSKGHIVAATGPSKQSRDIIQAIVYTDKKGRGLLINRRPYAAVLETLRNAQQE